MAKKQTTNQVAPVAVSTELIQLLKQLGLTNVPIAATPEPTAKSEFSLSAAIADVSVAAAGDGVVCTLRVTATNKHGHVSSTGKSIIRAESEPGVKYEIDGRRYMVQFRLLELLKK